MNFITGLPKVKGKDGIFVVVDILAKHAHFMPMPFESKPPQVGGLFFEYVFRLHSVPKRIVSDGDHIFISIF